MQKVVSSCFSFLVKTEKNREAGTVSGEMRVRDEEAGPGRRAVRRWNEHQARL